MQVPHPRTVVLELDVSTILVLHLYLVILVLIDLPASPLLSVFIWDALYVVLCFLYLISWFCS